jgi:hypothetical protein
MSPAAHLPFHQQRQMRHSIPPIRRLFHSHGQVLQQPRRALADRCPAASGTRRAKSPKSALPNPIGIWPSPVQADIVTESGASRVSALPGRVLATHRMGVTRACTIVHRDVRPSGYTLCVNNPRSTRGPHADQRTVARYLRGHPPEQQPGQPPHGAAGPTRRGVLCEPAAPLGAGGPDRRPAARRAARPWRGTRGRSWPAPGNDCPPAFCGRLWLSHCGAGKAALEIHPQQDEHRPMRAGT